MKDFWKIYLILFTMFVVGMLIGVVIVANGDTVTTMETELDSLRIENKELKKDLDSRQTVGPIKVF